MEAKIMAYSMDLRERVVAPVECGAIDRGGLTTV